MLLQFSQMKHKASKTDAVAAQNTLQKEITVLRETQRTLQLKLRDTEVANDDYERQARNTTSSLDDLVAKYETALERNTILEEEIRTIEQEREDLRIESQRLRDELSDLRVEADILKDKLDVVKTTNEFGTSRQIDTTSIVNESPTPSIEQHVAVVVPVSTANRTPLEELQGLGTSSATNSPPSPPVSEVSGSINTVTSNTSALKSETSSRSTQYRFADGEVENMASHPLRNTITPHFARPAHVRPSRSSIGPRQSLPRSGSLYQIRGLVGRMQQLEEKVQQVKSKLPPPVSEQGDLAKDASSGSEMLPATISVRRSSGRLSELKGLQRLAFPETSGQPRRLSHRPSRLSIDPSQTHRLTASSSHHADAQSHNQAMEAQPSAASSTTSRIQTQLTRTDTLKTNGRESLVSKDRLHEPSARRISRGRLLDVSRAGTSLAVQAPARSDRRISNRFGTGSGSHGNKVAADPP